MAGRAKKVKRPSPPSKTSIHKYLRDCVINPREDGPHRIIANHGSAYIEVRALELIQEAQECYDHPFDGGVSGKDLYHSKIKKAIGLLALSALKREQEE